MKVMVNKFITVSILITTNISYAGDKDNFMDPFCLSCKSRPKADTEESNKIQKSTHNIAQTSYSNQDENQNVDKNNVRKPVVKSTTSNKQNDTSEIQVVNESKQLQNINKFQKNNKLDTPSEWFNDFQDCGFSVHSINSYKNPDCYFKDNILNLSMDFNEFQDDISKKCYGNLTQKESSFQNNNSIYSDNMEILHPTKNNNNDKLLVEKKEDNKNGNILGKKRGRKSNSSGKIHDKFESGNCIRKVKTYLFKEILKFINSKIRKEYRLMLNSNNEMKMIDKKNCKYCTDSNIFIPKTIKEIFSGNINGKFKKVQEDYNMKLFEKLENDKKVEILKYINKNYNDYLKYFIGISNDVELEGMGTIDNWKRQISGEHEEYFDYLKRFIVYLITRGKNSSNKK